MKGSLDVLVNELLVCLEDEFYDLKINRYVFSFENGIYIIYKDEEIDKWVDKFLLYVSSKIGIDIVSCKLFVEEFIDCSYYEDWFDIIKKYCLNFMYLMNY